MLTALLGGIPFQPGASPKFPASLPAPAVSYLGADNLSRTAAGIVSVSGLSFGQHDSTPQGRLDGAACSSVG